MKFDTLFILFDTIYGIINLYYFYNSNSVAFYFCKKM